MYGGSNEKPSLVWLGQSLNMIHNPFGAPVSKCISAKEKWMWNVYCTEVVFFNETKNFHIQSTSIKIVTFSLWFFVSLFKWLYLFLPNMWMGMVRQEVINKKHRLGHLVTNEYMIYCHSVIRTSASTKRPPPRAPADVTQAPGLPSHQGCQSMSLL